MKLSLSFSRSIAKRDSKHVCLQANNEHSLLKSLVTNHLLSKSVTQYCDLEPVVLNQPSLLVDLFQYCIQRRAHGRCAQFSNPAQQFRKVLLHVHIISISKAFCADYEIKQLISQIRDFLCLGRFSVFNCKSLFASLSLSLERWNCYCNSYTHDSAECLSPSCPVIFFEPAKQASRYQRNKKGDGKQGIANIARLPVSEIYCHTGILS